jgi:hypothetical protein
MPFSQSFLIALKNLDSTTLYADEEGTNYKSNFSKYLFILNTDRYFDFFNEWGTHVATSVDFGALFGYEFEMSSSEVKKMTSNGFSVAVGVKGYGNSAKAKTSYESKSSEAFNSATKSWSSYSIGAAPDANNDAMAWAS